MPSHRVGNLNMRSAGHLVARLNAKLQPVHRGELFEDPLDQALDGAGVGRVSGGGTVQEESGEIACCDIAIEVTAQMPAAVSFVISTLEQLGAPKGSTLHIEAESREVPFGKLEGLAVYLNGTDLPDRVYHECDVNFVHSEFMRLLGGSGRVLSFWQGPADTAFYAYGASCQGMSEALAAFIASYPLCEKCRLVQIA